MSTLTPKTVSFNIHVGDVLDPHLANLEHIDPIEKSIMRLSEGLSNIQNEQKYLRLREMTHRDSKKKLILPSSKLLKKLVKEFCIGVFLKSSF
jgi:hypothetical protein